MNILMRWWRSHKLRSNNPTRRRQTAEILGALGDKARIYTVGKGYQSYAVDMLRKVLRDDSDANVRGAATKALGQLGLTVGASWVLRDLRDALLDVDEFVRHTAAAALRDCRADHEAAENDSDNTKAKRSLTSPNGKHVASLVGELGGYFIILDGKEQQKFDWIEEHSLTFSPNSNRIAYVAHKGDREFVVVDGKEERHYRNVSRWEPLFSPDSKRLAYEVSKGILLTEKWRYSVVIDGRRGRFYDHVGSFIFSPNSRFFAYEAANEGPIERTHFGDARLLSYFYLVVVQSTKYMRRWFKSARAKRIYQIPGRSGFRAEFIEDSKLLRVVDCNAKEIVLTVRLDKEFVF